MVFTYLLKQKIVSSKSNIKPVGCEREIGLRLCPPKLFNKLNANPSLLVFFLSLQSDIHHTYKIKIKKGFTSLFSVSRFLIQLFFG